MLYRSYRGGDRECVVKVISKYPWKRHFLVLLITLVPLESAQNFLVEKIIQFMMLHGRFCVGLSSRRL